MKADELQHTRRALLIAELNDKTAYKLRLESVQDGWDVSRWKEILHEVFGLNSWVLVGKPARDPKTIYVVASKTEVLSHQRVAAIEKLARRPVPNAS